MNDLFVYQQENYKKILTVMKTRCDIKDVEKVLAMDAVLVYTNILNNIRKDCYQAQANKP